MIDRLRWQNFWKLLEDGPRLRYDYNVWVEAKDTEHDMVLLGGLGGCGVGEMWARMAERHRGCQGFDGAPKRICPPYFRAQVLR